MKKLLIIALIAIVAVTAVFGLAACNKDKDWVYIEKQGKIIIGYTVFSPMNYTDGSGNFVGFDTELARAVCKELGVEAEFQLIKWENKFVELESKNIDAIWNGFTVTEERKQSTDFSISYLKNKQIAVVKKSKAAQYTSFESLQDAKLVAEKKSAGESAIMAIEGITFSYVRHESQLDAVNEVLFDRSDIAVVDRVMAEGTLKGESFKDLQILDLDLGGDEEYAIGFRKESPKTLEKVNAALKKLYADGTIQALAEKYAISESLIPIE